MSSLCAQQQDFDVNSLNSVAKFLLESTTETFQWLTSLCSNHGNKDLSELQCENNRFMCSRCSCGLRSRRHPGALLPSVAPCCSGPASLHREIRRCSLSLPLITLYFIAHNPSCFYFVDYGKNEKRILNFHPQNFGWV